MLPEQPHNKREDDTDDKNWGRDEDIRTDEGIYIRLLTLLAHNCGTILSGPI